MPDLAAQLGKLLIGQPEAIAAIVPYVRMFQVGLSPEGHPIGVILLIGPTGSGKTKTVEALAEVLHHSPKSMIRVDCGEYQQDHEIAKLIGSPPGYLGHKETPARLKQEAINSVTSTESSISLILFDEIEKASPSLQQILLGILDHATLRLGDASTTHFDKSLIFMTSNLGTRKMQPGRTPGFITEKVSRSQHKGTAQNAVKRHFSPEFANRIDETLTYVALTRGSTNLILDNIMAEVNARKSVMQPNFRCSLSSRELLLDRGVSVEYGARELKRLVNRVLVQPAAQMLMDQDIAAGSTFNLDAHEGIFSVSVALASTGCALALQAHN